MNETPSNTDSSLKAERIRHQQKLLISAITGVSLERMAQLGY